MFADENLIYKKKAVSRPELLMCQNCVVSGIVHFNFTKIHVDSSVLLCYTGKPLLSKKLNMGKSNLHCARWTELSLSKRKYVLLINLCTCTHLYLNC